MTEGKGVAEGKGAEEGKEKGKGVGKEKGSGVFFGQEKRTKKTPDPFFFSDIEGLWRSTAEWRKAYGTDIVPIADDGTGNQIILTFHKDRPTVELLVHDRGIRMIPVADSFGQFIDALCIDPEMI